MGWNSRVRRYFTGLEITESILKIEDVWCIPLSCASQKTWILDSSFILGLNLRPSEIRNRTFCIPTWPNFLKYFQKTVDSWQPNRVNFIIKMRVDLFTTTLPWNYTRTCQILLSTKPTCSYLKTRLIVLKKAWGDWLHHKSCWCFRNGSKR